MAQIGADRPLSGYLRHLRIVTYLDCFAASAMPNERPRAIAIRLAPDYMSRSPALVPFV